MGRAWFKRLLSLAGGTDAVTEGAASPTPSQSQSRSQGVDWSGILGALRQGSTPDGAASLDGGQPQTHSSAFVLHQQLTWTRYFFFLLIAKGLAGCSTLQET